MATALDLELPAEVIAILDEFGKDLTFDVRSKTPNAATGEPDYGSEPDVTVKGAPPWPYDKRLVDGDVVRAGDLQTIVAAQGLGFRPAIGQRCKFESASTTDPTESGPVEALVVGVTPIYSGELVCAWQFQLRI